MAFCCFLVCLPFSCCGSIATLCCACCCFGYIKKNKKRIQAEHEVELPALFDSSSEVSSDSISTDEETRAEEAKVALAAPAGSSPILTDAQKQRQVAREEQKKRREAKAQRMRDK